MQVRPLFSGLCGQPTARALCFAGAVLAVTPAWAKPIDYDIPAGTLAAALSQLAAASGVMITFSSEQTAGLSSPGLHGSYEVEQGFAHVLQGSGLRIVQAGEKRFVLASMEPGGALQLGATTIDAAGLGAITEGTGAYTTGATNAATKLALSLRETPQTVSVMTRQRMEDQQLTTLSDVLKQTPGLSVQNIDSERVNIYSRGYALDSYQFDGIPTTLIVQTSASPQSLIDTSVYDRVEIVRGATGLMTGAGDPSGSVNLVRKRPTAGFQGSVSAGAGSWDTYRTEVDVSGPLTTDARLRGRAVMAYQQGNSFIDHYQQEKQTYYGILEADLTDSTLLTVGFDYQKNDPRGVSFASFPLFYSDGGQTDFPRSINAGARWSYRQQNTLNTFATLEHGLANDWKLKAAVNNMYSTRD